jgi:hypothetical protein
MIIVLPTTILISNGGILSAETDSLGNIYIQHTYSYLPHVSTPSQLKGRNSS